MGKKLNVMERIVLLTILPQEGNIATLRLMRKLREELSMTADELKKYEMKQKGDQLTWSPKLAKESKDFKFDDFGIELIKSKLRKLNEDKKLEEKHFSLYEKFIEEKE